MANDLHHPHDKLFRTVFSDATEAADFLRGSVPETLSRELDWSTLTLLDGSFIDEALSESESDLLYQLEHGPSQERVQVYILFEHQSSADAWMRFRLLKYCCRIWDHSFRDRPEQVQLRPILPLVFYQGKRSWQHATEFAELFPAVMRDWWFVPHFAHTLIDQSGLEPAAVQGGVKGRLLQLLLLAAFRQPLREALDQAAQLLAALPPSGGVDYLRVFVRYVVATQDTEAVKAFGAAMQRHAAGSGGEIMTYAQELLQEGERKGRQEGKQEGERKGKQEGERKGKIAGQIETLENFLKAGVGWAVIESATGIDEKQLAALKQQLAEMTH